jgi:hypothetical protein
MVTSILEFFFSNHYLYDADNRFNTRIKNAVVLNNLKNQSLADTRLKKALFHFGLGVLDKMSIAQQPIAMVFGNIYFREDGRLIPAEIQIDSNRKGNVYVAIINDQTVITLKLFPMTISNAEIAEDIEKHDGTVVKSMYDMDNKLLSLTDKKRKTIVIDLDITDAEFMTLYPAPILKNNPYQNGSGGVSQADMIWIEKEKNSNPEKTVLTGHALTADMKAIVQEKEWVINKGSTILVRYPDGIKPKTIDEIIIDDKSSPRKFILRFKNTAKLYPLNIDSNFISSPKQQTDTYNKLIDAFDLDPKADFNFEGPIKRFMDYTKRNGSIGIVIEPKSIVY